MASPALATPSSGLPGASSRVASPELLAKPS